MATDNLQIPDIAAAQNQKEVTANAAHNLLDRAVNARVTKAITGDTAFTTTETREATLIELTGTPGAPHDITMPDTNQRVLAVFNNTDGIMTIQNSAAGGTGQPVIAIGDISTFHYDGTNFTELATPSTLAVEDEDVSVVAQASVLNFTGNVNVTDGGGGQADIAIGSIAIGAGVGVGDGPELVHDRVFSGSSSEDFKDLVPLVGETFFIEMRGIEVGTDDAAIEMVVSDDNGATFESTLYRYTVRAKSDTPGSNNTNSTSAAFLPITSPITGWGLINTLGGALDCDIELGELSRSDVNKHFKIFAMYQGVGGQGIQNYGSGYWNGDVTAINALQVRPDTGTFSGRIRIWRRRSTPNSIGIENLIINGDFRIAQRGTTFTAASVPANDDDTVLLDRWNYLAETADVADISQELTDIPAGAKAAMKALVATANNKFGFVQIIEGKDSHKIIGRKASLHFKAQTTTGNVINNIRAAIISWSSTEDAPTTDVVSVWGAQGTDPTLAANWTYENTPVDIPLTIDAYGTITIADISIDTASAANVAVFIWVDDTDAAAGDELFIADVKLNFGAAPSGFEMRPLEEELALCQRFYTKTFEQGTAPAQNSTALGSLGYRVQLANVNDFAVQWAFPVTMIKAPALTYYNPGAANALWRNVTGAADSGTPATDMVSDRGAMVNNPQVITTDTVGDILQVQVSADAEF